MQGCEGLEVREQSAGTKVKIKKVYCRSGQLVVKEENAERIKNNSKLANFSKTRTA